MFSLNILNKYTYIIMITHLMSNSIANNFSRLNSIKQTFYMFNLNRMLYLPNKLNFKTIGHKLKDKIQ